MIRADAELLCRVAGRAPLRLAAPLAEAINKWCPQYGIDTVDRMALFLAHGAHETDHFQTLSEYGSGDGPDPDQWDDYKTRLYDQRTDMGFTPEIDGDGELYAGRGFFHTTGPNNYRAAGERMGLDLIKEPFLLAIPDNAVRSACIFWSDNGLAALADANDVYGSTIAVNGGENGLEARAVFWIRAQRELRKRK